MCFCRNMFHINTNTHFTQTLPATENGFVLLHPGMRQRRAIQARLQSEALQHVGPVARTNEGTDPVCLGSITLFKTTTVYQFDEAPAEHLWHFVNCHLFCSSSYLAKIFGNCLGHSSGCRTNLKDKPYGRIILNSQNLIKFKQIGLKKKKKEISGSAQPVI